MKMRLKNIFETTKAKVLTKAILQSSCKSSTNTIKYIHAKTARFLIKSFKLLFIYLFHYFQVVQS